MSKSMPTWFTKAMADGGRVKREDGGRATISEDSKKYAAKKRDEATSQRGLRNVAGGTAGVLGVLGSVGNKLQRKGNWPLALGNAAISALSHGDAKDSDAEAERVEKGLVKPGYEDRAQGGRVTRKSGGKTWIAGATKNKGALHKALGVPAGEKIPAKKLDNAAHSDNPTMRRRANLAKTLKGFNK